jgi:hypothetical protein
VQSSEKENQPPSTQAQRSTLRSHQVSSSPSVPGSGPSSNAIAPEFSADSAYGSIVKKHQKSEKHDTNNATDVWWFTIPLEKKERPSSLPETAKVHPDEQPDEKKYQGLGCRLCP